MKLKGFQVRVIPRSYGAKLVFEALIGHDLVWEEVNVSDAFLDTAIDNDKLLDRVFQVAREAMQERLITHRTTENNGDSTDD
jgi:hypothetical protein